MQPRRLVTCEIRMPDSTNKCNYLKKCRSLSYCCCCYYCCCCFCCCRCCCRCCCCCCSYRCASSCCSLCYYSYDRLFLHPPWLVSVLSGRQSYCPRPWALTIVPPPWFRYGSSADPAAPSTTCSKPGRPQTLNMISVEYSRPDGRTK